MGYWEVIINWDDCPFIEFYDYSDNLCNHKKKNGKLCNRDKCPIRNKRA